jgi:hypothetical protein
VADVTRRDLKKFPRKVQDAVLATCEVEGVRARVLDGGHVLLLAPDGKTTLKVSASRSAQATLYYLKRQFLGRFQ